MNWGNLLVGSILVLAAVGIIAGIVKKHRTGGSCCCGCDRCGRNCAKR